MNEKINLQELTGLLSDKAGISKKDAETFLRELFNLMTEALIKDKLVKVKNLGSFKLTEVNERESVNVRTGERVVIPAHAKVSYTPTTQLGQTINEPFALFESIELDSENQDYVTNTIIPPLLPEDEDETDFTDTEDDEITDVVTDTEQPQVEPVTLLHAIPEIEEKEPEIPAEPEVPVIIPEIQQTVNEKEIINNPILTETMSSEQERYEESLSEREQPVNPVPEENNNINTDDEITPIIPPPGPPIPPTDYDEDDYSKEEKPKKKKGCLIPILLIIAFLLLLIAGAGYYIYKNNIDIMSCLNQKKSSEVILIDETISHEDTATHDMDDQDIDSLAIESDSIKPIASEAITEKHVDEPKVQPKVESTPKQQQTTTPKTNEKPKQTSTSSSSSGGSKTWVMKSGERLTIIALREYGHKAFWVYLYEENKAKIKNPDSVPAGLEITIPPAKKYNIDKNNPESLKKAKKLACTYLDD